MSWYREQLENWLKTIDVNADIVIDIGGGSNPVKDRVKSWNVGKYLIFDKGIEDARPDVITIDYDLNKQDSFGIQKRNADIVFCLEVFEYVWSPVQATKNIYDLLKEGGKAYITFPFVYPWHEPKNHDYLRYTKAGISKLLEQAGFDKEKVTFIPRVDRSMILRHFYKVDGMHCCKEEDHDVTGWIVEARK